MTTRTGKWCPGTASAARAGVAGKELGGSSKSVVNT